MREPGITCLQGTWLQDHHHRETRSAYAMPGNNPCYMHGWRLTRNTPLREEDYLYLDLIGSGEPVNLSVEFFGCESGCLKQWF
ncbi:hypothetical protein M9434_004836 [Picochlorum sp. BPE23]|nr:hypothetical protein M9434_004836 [Picochlorum sp. BPE23]